MKYEINGFSTPFGGISWNKNATGKDLFVHLFLYLESKRILTNPIEMEKKEWCIDSVLEIKANLVALTNGISLSQFDLTTIRNLIDSCNRYLDAVSPMELPTIIFKNGDQWEDVRFDKAMKTFRFDFKNEIKSIEKKYKLHFNKEIPEKY